MSADTLEPMIHSGERSIPRAEMEARAARAASGFATLGVHAGDAIAILMRNDLAMLEAGLAASKLGAYCVPLNWHFAGAEIAYVINDCDAKALVVHADLLPLLEGQPLPEDLAVIVADTPPEVCAAYRVGAEQAKAKKRDVEWSAWLSRFDVWRHEPGATLESILYTSGTTGKPKGVRRQVPTPEQQARTQQMRATTMGLVPGIRLIVPAPLYHGAPNVFAMRGLRLAQSLVITPRFDAEELLQAIERHRATTIVMVPTMFVRLLRLPKEVRERYDISSLRAVYHAAAPCPPDVKRAMIDWWGPIIHEWYGTTETSAVTFCTSEEWLANPGTVGKPIEGARVEVVDEQGNLCPPGVQGEVYMGLDFYPDFTYHKRDAERKAIGRGSLISGGDIGYFNERGFLFICDRKRDMIISGGVNIYPAEVESALLSCAEVQDCAVIGIPDAEYGESVLALVVPSAGHDANDVALKSRIMDRIAGSLARYKLPKRIEFREQLPRDDAGKLLKRLLRQPYWERAQRQV